MRDNDSDMPMYTRRRWLKAIAVAVAGVATGDRVLSAAPAGNRSVACPLNGENAGGSTERYSRKVSRISARQAVGCTECDACMPCGYGIDIPGNFRYYNDMLASGGVPDILNGDTESADFARKAKRFLRGYNRAVDDAHQSQRCIKCFHCVNECRHGVFIVNELVALTELTDFLRDWECSH